MEVNEKTFCFVPVTFLDENQQPVIPTNVIIGIIDVKSGTVIRPPTPLIVTQPTENVYVSSNENRIINDTDENNIGEIHLMTVECDIPNGHSTGQHEIFVRNLRGVQS